MGSFLCCRKKMTMRAKEYEGMPPSAWQSMWHSCRDKHRGKGLLLVSLQTKKNISMWRNMHGNKNNLTHWNSVEAMYPFFFELRSQCHLQPYPCPVAEGQHQGNQSGFQFRQSCQVIGGETSNVIPCTDFTHQAAAKEPKWGKTTIIKFLNWLNQS